MSCNLCKIAYNKPLRDTKTWHDDDICFVITGRKRGVPMIATKRHTLHPTERETTHLESIIESYFQQAKRVYSYQSCPNHWHCHLYVD